MGEFRDGLLASLPIVMGYIPVAVAFGAAAVASGFSEAEAFTASALIFAGASQFALVSLAGQSLILAAVIPIALNLRHIAYSLVISRRIRMNIPALTAFGLTDEVFASSINAGSEKFVWGLEVGAYASWTLGTLMGVMGGAALLSISSIAASLGFAITVLFFVLLIPYLNGKHLVSAITAGVTAVVFHVLGYTSVGILLSAVIAPAVALKLSGGDGNDKP